MADIQFLGATRTVTGSKHLVKTVDSHLLVDCGLFQGPKELRLRNWEPLPIDLAALSAVILTHAHIDHSGYLPRLCAAGFNGPVYASSSTCGLCGLLLPDSGKLQEEDARYANRRGFSKHKPALPLYTEAEARASLRLLEPRPFGAPITVGSGLTAVLGVSGHILGSAFVQLNLQEERNGAVRLVFSGDLGRYNRPILNDPAPPPDADYLVLESTYGDRLHGTEDPKDALAEIVSKTIERGGSVIIPAFAVGRTQELLYLLTELREEKRMPQAPIFVDSPMAISATAEYLAHTEEHDAAMKERMMKRLDSLRRMVQVARSQSESRAITNRREPAVILSASGMVTGGRILHHLAARLPDPKNTVLFAGFQAAGTRGRTILDGAGEVKIHGRMVPVRAQVAMVHELSAHADYAETLTWLRGFHKPPKLTFLVHGEPGAADALAERIRRELGWETLAPEYMQEVRLE